MKELNRELQSVLKSLKALSQKANKMIKTLDKLEKSQMGKKAKAKPMKKAPARRLVGSKEKKLTAADTILNIIKRSRKAVDTATLEKKTGFEGRKTRDIVYKLKKQGKIKKVGKGTYAKAG